MIPKIIHYCWFGGNPLPTDVKRCIESWKKMCPDYEIKRWDESNFDVNAHPFTKAAYEAKAWAFVSDYARLKVVCDNGGIYLDTDVELLKNLDSLREYQCYIGVQQAGHLCNTGLGFGATKSNPVVQQMLRKYDEIVFSEERKTEFVNLGRTLVLPPKYLDPIAPGEGMKLLRCEDTISIHHYSASWMGNKTRLKRRIIRIIGQENVSKIKQFCQRLKMG